MHTTAPKAVFFVPTEKFLSIRNTTLKSEIVGFISSIPNTIIDATVYENETLRLTTLQLRQGGMNPELMFSDINSIEESWKGAPSLGQNHNGGAMAYGTTRFSQLLNYMRGSIIRVNANGGDILVDNPFSQRNGHLPELCPKYGGYDTSAASEDAVCAEILVYEFFNPFHIAVDPRVADNVPFTNQDESEELWEETCVGGTDYAGQNDGWSIAGGVCRPYSRSQCPRIEDPNSVEPFRFNLYGNRRLLPHSYAACIPGGAFDPGGGLTFKIPFQIQKSSTMQVCTVVSEEHQFSSIFIPWMFCFSHGPLLDFS
jgi:hypothetical protein